MNADQVRALVAAKFPGVLNSPLAGHSEGQNPMLTTTLNAIRVAGPCRAGWEKLLRHLGKSAADDEPLPFAVIVESNGLNDALWCARAAPQYAREWRLFAAWCARQVQHLMTDPRSIAALDVAEQHASGLATDSDLTAAWDTALDAARDASWDAVRDTALDTARDAAWAAAWAVARDAAWAAAWAATWAATLAAPRDKFLEIVNGG